MKFPLKAAKQKNKGKLVLCYKIFSIYLALRFGSQLIIQFLSFFEKSTSFLLFTVTYYYSFVTQILKVHNFIYTSPNEISIFLNCVEF